MSGARMVSGALALLLLAVRISGDEAVDKKVADKKAGPPRVLLTLPLAVAAGTTNQLRLRGLNLTNAFELRFTNDLAGATLSVNSTGNAEVPKDYDAKRIGDTQVEASVFIPALVLPTTNWLVVRSQAGFSEALPVLGVPQGALVAEPEPNGGFREAPMVTFGQFILGSIKESGDVDVFRFEVQAGQIVTAEIHAAMGGSALDSLLTLYDDAGNVLVSNDDIAAGNRDSRVEWKARATGRLAVSVQDANDKGGLAHAYVLRVSDVK